MSTEQTKISFNLLGLDANIFRQVKKKVEKKAGMEASNIQILRMAIAALSEKVSK